MWIEESPPLWVTFPKDNRKVRVLTSSISSVRPLTGSTLEETRVEVETGKVVSWVKSIGDLGDSNGFLWEILTFTVEIIM